MHLISFFLSFFFFVFLLNVRSVIVLFGWRFEEKISELREILYLRAPSPDYGSNNF
jgi:hypothetical protein